LCHCHHYRVCWTLERVPGSRLKKSHFTLHAQKIGEVGHFSREFLYFKITPLLNTFHIESPNLFTLRMKPEGFKELKRNDEERKTEQDMEESFQGNSFFI